MIPLVNLPTSKASLVRENRVRNHLKLSLQGVWVAQLVKHLTSAHVMTPEFMTLSPASGSVLTALSPEPASVSVSPSLSAPPLLALSLSLSLKNKH